MTDAATEQQQVTVPAMGLVVLVGVSGSGKSTFAAATSSPPRSSPATSAAASSPTTRTTSPPPRDAFDVLHYIVGTRLRRGLLTVVDATNVQQSAARLAGQARQEPRRARRRHRHRRPRVGRDRAQQAAARPRLRRARGRPAAPRPQAVPPAPEQGGLPPRPRPARHRPDRGRRDRPRAALERPHGRPRPFDIIGDVHGCASELRTLLTELGWQIEYDGDTAVGAAHPEGRQAVFVGDLVDRGPDTPGVLGLVMGMVESGNAAVRVRQPRGQAVRALKGSKVTVSHGLAESLAQLEGEPEEFRKQALDFMDGLISHYVLDDGKLVVAHAGLKEAYHGRSSGGSARSRCTATPPARPTSTGSRSATRGRRSTAARRWSSTATPRSPRPSGSTTPSASTPASYSAASSPHCATRSGKSSPSRRRRSGTHPSGRSRRSAGDREAAVLKIGDVAGTRWLETTHAGKVKIPEENAAAALEVMSRFAVDPRWLIYLPPTMSPVATSKLDGFLEHPAQAFDEYAGWGVTRVVCEEKHMGSRAVAVIAKDADAAERRFGVGDGTTGVVYTRTGRPFFADTSELVDRLRRPPRHCSSPSTPTGSPSTANSCRGRQRPSN